MSQTPPKRILLVDDDSGLRSALTDYLTLRGLEVTSAGNFVEALQHAGEPGFEVLIIDHGMCDDGRCQQLRERHSESIVFVISGHNREQISFTFQPNGFLQKPFHPERLVEAILEASSA